MIFTALDVKVGDSFILNDGNHTFIVDGGNNENGIISKLTKVKISYIDVLICTHYDMDHLNGIIGIAKSTKYHINEIWLPDIFGDIALTLSHKEEIFYNLISQNNTFNNINKEKSLNNYYEKNDIDYEKIDTNTSELFNVDFLEYINNCFQHNNCCIPYFKTYVTENIIKKIATLIITSIKSGAHIRWLKYYENYRKIKIANQFDLYSLNSHETTLVQYDEHQIFFALYCLTLINKESLVFLYDNINFPNILFTSESDFKFIKGTMPLKDSSIVTAPHHGSLENSNVYGIISGNNLIYVRCDKSQTFRPCNEYIQLPKKYCTICRNITKKSPVILHYNNNSWNTCNQLCKC